MKRPLIAVSAALALAGGASLGAFAQPQLDGAVIIDSGSTNFRGYHLKVWNDGTALPVMTPENAMRTRQDVGKQLTDQFFSDVQAGRANPGTPQTCMKSASFGHTLRVTYHGWTSPDLTCLAGTSAAVGALAKDVESLTTAAHVSGQQHTGPARVIPHPSDMRQTPGAEGSMPPIKTMVPRPTASPNPSPSSRP